MKHRFVNRNALRALVAVAALGLGFAAPQAMAQAKKVIRISTPAVPDDWHAKMWTVFKDSLEKSAPGEFDVQIHLNAALFKQGTEPAAMARGNLEMSAISAQDISKLVPEFSIFTAGYIIRDPDHQQKVFNGPIGEEVFKPVVKKMDVTPLATAYLGTRQVMLREDKNVMTPADLKGVKLRMPGSKEWLFLGEALGATATPLAFGEVYLALKTGTIDGQDNPLPSARAAKFFEVSKTVVMTNHLVDAIFLSYATKYNNENRIKDEASIVDEFKAKGMKIVKPNVDEFRKVVQDKYLKSEYANIWPKGLLEKINAVK